jgi:hypothetical protein
VDAPHANNSGPTQATDEVRTLEYPQELITLTNDRTWAAYGVFAGAARRLAELDPQTDELVRIQNAAVQSCHY